jgi:hypothetical protein
MKLTSVRTAYAAKQLEAFPLPETHPMMSSLCELFGEHTFFLDNDGLSIVEPEEIAAPDEGDLGVLVKLANWADEGRTVLCPHVREVTTLVLMLSEAA